MGIGIMYVLYPGSLSQLDILSTSEFLFCEFVCMLIVSDAVSDVREGMSLVGCFVFNA
jgi:hypothetical protein